MKKLRSRKGMTLIETLAALLITVLLVVAMGSGLSAATRIYNDSNFAVDSNSLCNVVNTSLGDILRYAQNVRQPGMGGLNVSESGTSFVDNSGTIVPNVEFVFTSLDYGIQDAYFDVVPDENNGSCGKLQLRSLRSDVVMDLINTGVYPDLGIANFEITYTAADPDSYTGGYFNITYTIVCVSDEEKNRDISLCVRLLNPKKK